MNNNHFIVSTSNVWQNLTIISHGVSEVRRLLLIDLRRSFRCNHQKLQKRCALEVGNY